MSLIVIKNIEEEVSGFQYFPIFITNNFLYLKQKINLTKSRSTFLKIKCDNDYISRKECNYVKYKKEVLFYTSMSFDSFLLNLNEEYLGKYLEHNGKRVKPNITVNNVTVHAVGKLPFKNYIRRIIPIVHMNNGPLIIKTTVNYTDGSTKDFSDVVSPFIQEEIGEGFHMNALPPICKDNDNEVVKDDADMLSKIKGIVNGIKSFASDETVGEIESLINGL